MCNPKPGARCANHVSKSLKATENKLQRAQTRIAAIEETFTRKKAEGKPITDTERRKWFDLQDRVKDYSNDVKTYQRQYDATKTGQKKLYEEIGATNSVEQQRPLLARLRQGILLKSFHDAAVAKQKEEQQGFLAAA